MKRFLTSIFLAGVSQLSFAGIFTLKFERVAPLSNQERCQVFAQATAQQLTTQSEAHVIDYGCQQDDATHKGWYALITYQSPTKLDITSTYSDLIYSAAFYSSLGACENEEQLALQRQLFTSATGLKPLATYCMLAIESDQKWQLRIDAVGQSHVKPRATGVRFWGVLIDKDAVLRKYRAAAPSYGLTPYEAGVSDDGLGKQLVLRHYSEQPYIMKDYNEMTYERVEDCTAAASLLESKLTPTSKPAVIFCVKNSNDNRTTLYATAFENVFTPQSVFNATLLATKFSTLAACQQASNDFEAGADDVLAAICAGADEEFRIHLFSRPQ